MVLKNLSDILSTRHYWVPGTLITLHPSPNINSVSKRKDLSTPFFLVAVIQRPGLFSTHNVEMGSCR